MFTVFCGMLVMSYIVNEQIYYRMRLECTIRPVQHPRSLRRTALLANKVE
jgi:hypothetical protein